MGGIPSKSQWLPRKIKGGYKTLPEKKNSASFSDSKAWRNLFWTWSYSSSINWNWWKLTEIA